MSLKIEYASIAQCRPEHIWRVFEQIELWPRWAPEAIREVRWVRGEAWSKGAQFSIEMLKPKAFKLTPEVLEVEPPTYVHLRGKGSGVTGEQYFFFRWMPDEQTTELRTLQEFSGAPVMLMGGKIKPSIESGVKYLFARVAEEAEAFARGQASGPPIGG
jgi:Polyketide cyclase / dehydrase and lipid transport